MAVLIKVPDAARLMNVPTHGVYRLIREEIIPPQVVARIGTSVRIHEARLVEWLENGGTGAGGAK